MTSASDPDPSRLAAFWAARLADMPHLPEPQPAAWAFGATPAHADDLLALVIQGVKTATASALWDHEATGEPVPVEGELSIILDGRSVPRALIETARVRIVPFHEVDAAHAAAEGEGDRSLTHWRQVHECYWREHSANPRGYEPGMPVVCEEFRLLYPPVGVKAGEPAEVD
ncbi:ASCH domain-containing protein [Demequina aestuarii]|uniref:ASCH domain-containing protein n=1 Tax=Demequina aestuarii TaxID=327095 RepID=UPI0007843341|nr:ASCH domain-containing protein [Demequina aestuarii]